MFINHRFLCYGTSNLIKSVIRTNGGKVLDDSCEEKTATHIVSDVEVPFELKSLRKPIVKTQYVSDCVSHKKILETSKYLQINKRHLITCTKEGIFDGYVFFVEKGPQYEQLVREIPENGGSVVRETEFARDMGFYLEKITFFVPNLGPTTRFLQQRFDDNRDVFMSMYLGKRFQMIGSCWILESIAAKKVVGVVEEKHSFNLAEALRCVLEYFGTALKENRLNITEKCNIPVTTCEKTVNTSFVQVFKRLFLLSEVQLPVFLKYQHFNHLVAILGKEMDELELRMMYETNIISELLKFLSSLEGSKKTALFFKLVANVNFRNLANVLFGKFIREFALQFEDLPEEEEMSSAQVAAAMNVLRYSTKFEGGDFSKVYKMILKRTSVLDKVFKEPLKQINTVDIMLRAGFFQQGGEEEGEGLLGAEKLRRLLLDHIKQYTKFALKNMLNDFLKLYNGFHKVILRVLSRKFFVVDDPLLMRKRNVSLLILSVLLFVERKPSRYEEICYGLVAKGQIDINVFEKAQVPYNTLMKFVHYFRRLKHMVVVRKKFHKNEQEAFNRFYEEFRNTFMQSKKKMLPSPLLKEKKEFPSGVGGVRKAKIRNIMNPNSEITLCQGIDPSSELYNSHQELFTRKTFTSPVLLTEDTENEKELSVFKGLEMVVFGQAELNCSGCDKRTLPRLKCRKCTKVMCKTCVTEYFDERHWEHCLYKEKFVCFHCYRKAGGVQRVTGKKRKKDDDSTATAKVELSVENDAPDKKKRKTE